MTGLVNRVTGKRPAPGPKSLKKTHLHQFTSPGGEVQTAWSPGNNGPPPLQLQPRWCRWCQEELVSASCFLLVVCFCAHWEKEPHSTPTPPHYRGGSLAPNPNEFKRLNSEGPATTLRRCTVRGRRSDGPLLVVMFWRGCFFGLRVGDTKFFFCWCLVLHINSPLQRSPWSQKGLEPYEDPDTRKKGR